MVKISTQRQVEVIRTYLRANDFDAIVIPTEDPHLSEYVPSYFAKREWVTGYNGSAGVALIGLTHAFLWVDPRYWEQAADQVDPKIFTVMRDRHPDVKPLGDFIAESADCSEITRNDPKRTVPRIAFDFRVTPISTLRSWTRKGDMARTPPELIPAVDKRSGEDIVDLAWRDFDATSTDGTKPRPVRPSNEIFPFAHHAAHVAVQRRVDSVVAALRKASVDATVIVALDSIAWLTGLRGSDITHCPVFLAYAVVDIPQATPSDTTAPTPMVTVYASNIPSFIAAFGPAGIPACIRVAPYDKAIETIAAQVGPASGKRILLDPTATPSAVYLAVAKLKDGSPVTSAKVGVASAANVVEKPCVINAIKAVKAPEELAEIAHAHVLDGAALCSAFGALSAVMEKGPADAYPDEVGVDDFIRAGRELYGGETFVSPSFSTIAGSGPNGAIIHYRAERPSARRLTKDEIILIDSGGQFCGTKDGAFAGGTTDVTRTLCFTENPPAEQIEAYTAVLRGHLALNAVVYPALSTTGVCVDAYARMFLWQIGLDFGHGTGHGVGHFLNVHEGPFGIASKPRLGCDGEGVPLAVGHVVSNEPGYYKVGHFGIRIENVEFVQAVATKHGAGPDEAATDTKKKFLKLHAATLVPYEPRLINWSILTAAEKKSVCPLRPSPTCMRFSAVLCLCTLPTAARSSSTTLAASAPSPRSSRATTRRSPGSLVARLLLYPSKHITGVPSWLVFQVFLPQYFDAGSSLVRFFLRVCIRVMSAIFGSINLSYTIDHFTLLIFDETFDMPLSALYDGFCDSSPKEDY